MKLVTSHGLPTLGQGGWRKENFPGVLGIPNPHTVTFLEFRKVFAGMASSDLAPAAAPSVCMCQQGCSATYPQGGQEPRAVLSFTVLLEVEDLAVLLPVIVLLVSLVYWMPRPDVRRKPSDTLSPGAHHRRTALAGRAACETCGALLLSPSEDPRANSSVCVLVGDRPRPASGTCPGSAVPQKHSMSAMRLPLEQRALAAVGKACSPQEVIPPALLG